jgi:hypothetical protein
MGCSFHLVAGGISAVVRWEENARTPPCALFPEEQGEKAGNDPLSGNKTP